MRINRFAVTFAVVLLGTANHAAAASACTSTYTSRGVVGPGVELVAGQRPDCDR